MSQNIQTDLQTRFILFFLVLKCLKRFHFLLLELQETKIGLRVKIRKLDIL